MVKVTIKPWEEIVIHESIKYDFEDFITLCRIGVQPGGLAQPLKWAEGIVFRYGAMPPTNEVTKEMLESRIHWISVEWAVMPKYQQVVILSDINAKIPIINVSNTAILCDVAKTLKESLKNRFITKGLTESLRLLDETTHLEVSISNLRFAFHSNNFMSPSCDRFSIEDGNRSPLNKNRNPQSPSFNS